MSNFSEAIASFAVCAVGSAIAYFTHDSGTAFGVVIIGLLIIWK